METKALGCNFGATTCESCKAFFRRNALKGKVGSLCPATEFQVSNGQLSVRNFVAHLRTTVR